MGHSGGLSKMEIEIILANSNKNYGFIFFIFRFIKFFANIVHLYQYGLRKPYAVRIGI